jgi:agmatine/peptidylarginine deiminase
LIIVPVYGIDEDILALNQIQNIYSNCTIELINFSAIIKESGALHCVSSEKLEFEKRDKREF